MYYRFFELMQRIFKYGDIHNITLTPDKELNILIYRTPYYVIIDRSYTFKYGPGLFVPPCTVSTVADAHCTCRLKCIQPPKLYAQPPQPPQLLLINSFHSHPTESCRTDAVGCVICTKRKQWLDNGTSLYRAT